MPQVWHVYPGYGGRKILLSIDILEHHCTHTPRARLYNLAKTYRVFEEKPSKWIVKGACDERTSHTSSMSRFAPRFFIGILIFDHILESQEPPASRTCRHGLEYEQLWHMAWWILFQFSGRLCIKISPEEIAVWVKDGAYELSSRNFAFHMCQPRKDISKCVP